MAQGTMLTPLQNMPQPNMSPNWLQQTSTNLGKQPKFPRLRNWWEGVKSGGGQFLFGNPSKIEQVPTVNSQQQQILEFLQQLGVQGLQDPYAGFDAIEQHARNKFSQQTVPSIAERFVSMGNNALSSPVFATQLAQAGAGLESDLAAQRAAFGQQNMGQILQMLQLGLNPQSENIFRPQQNGLAQQAILALVKSLSPLS